MKKLLLVILGAMFLVSCSKNEGLDSIIKYKLNTEDSSYFAEDQKTVIGIDHNINNEDEYVFAETRLLKCGDKNYSQEEFPKNVDEINVNGRKMYSVREKYDYGIEDEKTKRERIKVYVFGKLHGKEVDISISCDMDEISEEIEKKFYDYIKSIEFNKAFAERDVA